MKVAQERRRGEGHEASARERRSWKDPAAVHVSTVTGPGGW